MILCVFSKSLGKYEQVNLSNLNLRIAIFYTSYRMRVVEKLDTTNAQSHLPHSEYTTLLCTHSQITILIRRHFKFLVFFGYDGIKIPPLIFDPAHQGSW